MKAVTRRLTPRDFDWLRKLACASDANCDAPSPPPETVETLRAFGLAFPSASERLVITERGRGALLEQDMRDAEER
jgi:hypothetical protein